MDVCFVVLDHFSFEIIENKSFNFLKFKKNCFNRFLGTLEGRNVISMRFLNTSTLFLK